MDNQNTVIGQEIRVRGLVQGVGFRPAVWRIAKDFHLSGEVFNDAAGVLIRIWGTADHLHNFLEQLKNNPPPLARINAIEITLLVEPSPSAPFKIVHSQGGTVSTSIVADAATCDDCLEDIGNQDNRRFRYPFTNCTNCGPRLSITHTIPYDRAHTSMSSFKMCPDCLREYENPADRRFHAQPNACPVCGPVVWLSDKNGKAITCTDGMDNIAMAANFIKQGKIVAIKGIGGFHLACDASSHEAVQRLRDRKKRQGKPLAIMAQNMEMAEKYIILDAETRKILSSSQSPILLVIKRKNHPSLAESLAPGQNRLGIMLPYSPLHHLLMGSLKTPIVLTSGNISDSPQVTDNEEALTKLADIADIWLMNDRDIVNKLDDSVVLSMTGQPRILRRSRGYAPEPLILPKGFEDTPNILAMGSQLKNSFCLLKKGQAIVSQHIGDLENSFVHHDYRKMLGLYQNIHEFTPERIAVDLHPDYFSTRLGENLAGSFSCELDYVQHHHAHIAACLAEHGIPLKSKKVIGVIFDGLGYGKDGRLWGGEFLLADYCTAKRVAHFLPVALLGGEKATYEPWRNTFAHLSAALGWEETKTKFSELGLISYLEKKPVSQMLQMIERNLNSPKSSSAGRLFDGVAAALDICADSVSFEGQAAMQLQTLAETCPEEKGYYNLESGEVISWTLLWSGILNDLADDIKPAVIAAKFHNSLTNVIEQTISRIAGETGTECIVLSGGVFQNALLLEKTQYALRKSGFTVLSPRKFPSNDGGISLGQAVISAARYIRVK